jgi:hypothetical protein
MSNIPVNVDQDGKTLRGNENVMCFEVDGRPSKYGGLQQIPSASIKKIELITNPSAKYNLECLWDQYCFT